jgi:AcrR family transcriptional regulator
VPRPRKVSDDEVYAAAYRAMQRLGPGELTLAHIAEEAGVTAGALVQRFGSKRELLLALAAGAAASAPDFLRDLRARNRSPLATIRAYAACLAGLAASPAALARNLAYLQIDLTDADFRTHLAAQARSNQMGLRELIEEAIARGELAPATNAGKLARLIETVLSGSLMTWATYQRGAPATWLRDDVDAALAPYLAQPRRTRKR